MRDERLGAFAFTGGAMLILLKFAGLMEIQFALAPLLLAPSLGRWAMALLIVIFPYARLEGLGNAMKTHASWPQILWATIIVLLSFWLVSQWIGVIALVVVFLLSLAAANFALRRLDGLTGDIYGAVCELSELSVLLLFIALGTI